MKRSPLVLLAVAGAGAAAAPLVVTSSAPAQDAGAPAACAYDATHPAPVTLGQLPAQVVSGRRVSPQVLARVVNGKLADPNVTALSQSYERITDDAVTFEKDLLADYKQFPGQEIGYDAQLDSADSPGERSILSWTDDDPSLPAHPCTGQARTRDMHVIGASHAKRVSVSSRSGVTDRRKGDAAALRIGGKTCALTDPSALTIRATSGRSKRTLRLDMACGAFSSAGAKLGGVALLSDDGQYRRTSVLVLAAHSGAKAGRRVTVSVYKGKKRLATKRFHVARSHGRLKVVAG